MLLPNEACSPVILKQLLLIASPPPPLQATPLDSLLLARHIQPARDRSFPLTLELCLRIPPGTQQLTLTAQFSKTFLHVWEHPPDAHRGFDIPSATVAYVDLQRAGRVGWQLGWTSGVAAGAGENPEGLQQLLEGGGDDLGALTGPLLQALAGVAAVQVVHSEGLLVQLATPDFSMPYNVICLSSTVMAVFVGAVFNTLIKRPGAEAEQCVGAVGSEGAKARTRKTVLQFVLLLALFAGLGMYFDPDMRELVLGGGQQQGAAAG